MSWCVVSVLLVFLSIAGTSQAQDFRAIVHDGAVSAVDHNAGLLHLRAKFNPTRYAACTWMAGHHAVVWSGGEAAVCALFTVEAPDREVHEMLVGLGAKPGNNLTMETWTQRKQARHPEPKKTVEGTPIQATVWIPEWKEPKPLASLIDDSGGKGISLRFGGHEQLIHEFQSGCVICLHSCPGGKVSNEKYTLRDYALSKTVFSLKENALPKGTEHVVITLQPVPAKAAPGKPGASR